MSKGNFPTVVHLFAVAYFQHVLYIIFTWKFLLWDPFATVSKQVLFCLHTIYLLVLNLIEIVSIFKFFLTLCMILYQGF